MQTKRRDVLCVLFLGIVVGHIALSQALARWWALGVQGQGCAASHTECKNCADTKLLTSEQQALCSDNGEAQLVRAISRGTLECIHNCQQQFANSKWNCTTFHGDHLFGSFVENATRETAILNAFLSAGAVQGIAAACHENVIDGCSCEAGETTRVDGVTYLQDCNEDVDFAISFLKKFYGLEDSVEERDLVDKWNNEIGYTAVNNRNRFCRCTGLSGSCVVQTCYEKAPSIEEIGSKLQPRYDGSQKVQASNGTLNVVGHNLRPPIPGFPCYVNDTPDLCQVNNRTGVLGTSGRKCDPLSSGSNSCHTFCCNGFDRHVYDIQREKCRFVWCCRIECEKLDPVEVTDYVCL